jgi:hypothetical protein
MPLTPCSVRQKPGSSLRASPRKHALSFAAARAAGTRHVNRAMAPRNIDVEGNMKAGAGAISRGVSKGGSKRYGPC